MNGSRSGVKGWVATCLVVITISTVLGYSPQSRADSGCSLTAARAQQIENALRADRNASHGGWAGLGVLAVGFGLLCAGMASGGLALPIIGAAVAIGGGGLALYNAWNLAGPIQAAWPRTPCEKKFAALPETQREEVIGLLKRGDTSGAMTLVDTWTPPPPQLPPLPPNWTHLGLDPAYYSGYPGSRGASTAALASSPSGPGNSGGQTR